MSNSIIDRVNAMYRANVGGNLMVDLDEVLAIVANAVPIELDMNMYSEVLKEATDAQKETLAVISTAYNLLADKAAEFASADVREKATAMGIELAPDAEVFEKNKDNQSAGPRSYRDLAERNPDFVQTIGDIFESLLEESIRKSSLPVVRALSGGLHDGEML